MLEGLKRKRADITGEIARLQARWSVLTKDLEHVDGVLAMLAPDFVQEAVKPKIFTPPASWSKRGEMSRVVLNILRTAPEPLTTREIASMVIKQRGLEVTSATLNIMTRRVGHCLRDKRERGTVRSIEETGLWLQWEVVR